MIIIIGAGLSGLLIAAGLKKQGKEFVILEARDRIGGRIFTKNTANGAPLEMGATWLGNQHRQLLLLLQNLEVDLFEQYHGDQYYYHAPRSPYSGLYPLTHQPPSYRISGGTNVITHRLVRQVGTTSIHLNKVIKTIKNQGNEVAVYDTQGNVYNGEKVVVTIPPKIWAHSVIFEPALPEQLMEMAIDTQTWMEDATKLALTYERPFWRSLNNAGFIMSPHGPYTECYDHSDREASAYALCGFVSHDYIRQSEEQRLTSVLEQLNAAWGSQAQDFVEHHEYLWGDDPYTKAPKSAVQLPHQNNGHPIFRETYWDGLLLLSGTETASEFAGYMEGAVIAAQMCLDRLGR